MKALFLYSGSRYGVLDKAKKGETHINGFWGMTYLPLYGIEAEYFEIEQYLPMWLAKFVRKTINIYFIHLPFFWKMLSRDIVFTSAAFGTQLFHALLHLKKPLWIMHDFSITGLLGNEKTFRQKLFRFMVSQAAGIVTLSEDEKEKLEERFPRLKGKVAFIPFGVDLNFFKPQNLPKKKQILAVGFDPDRDWGTLIAAVKDIDARVVLATRMSRVEKYLPLPVNVEVTQFSGRDLVKEYDKSAVIIVPLNTSSHNNDAMGCSALFEGMAMGRPVIATRTKTIESYVKNKENGLLVKEGSVAEMEEAINFVLNNQTKAEEIGKNAYEYAIKNLDAKKCTAVLADFFKRIYKEAKG